MKFTYFTSIAAIAAVTACAPMPTASVQSETAANKTIVTGLLEDMFVDGDVAAIDRVYAEDMIQHNPDMPNGRAPLKAMVEGLTQNPAFKSEYVRVIAEGDTVATHARFDGWGPKPMIVFDVFRLEDGKIVEHWDNIAEQTPPNPSGHSQIDGATEITDLDKTQSNKKLVEDLLVRGLVNGEHLDFTQFINPQTYIQHNSDIGDGLGAFGGFLQSMGEQGTPMKYNEVHQVIGEGNFVLAMSDGAFGADRYAFYDLFRLEDGLIVEHWDIIAPMPGPDATHNAAGKF